MKTKTKKIKSDPVGILFNKYFANKPVNIMDTPKIHKDITKLIQDTADYHAAYGFISGEGSSDETNAYLDQGMQNIVNKYHKHF